LRFVPPGTDTVVEEIYEALNRKKTDGRFD
jgi:hypothetical protein